MSYKTNRRSFLQQLGALGLSATFFPSLFACGKPPQEEPPIQVNFTGKALIVGAGAAGLMAGYLLKQHDIDFQIIEASGIYGGRVKKIENFADFPIDLGAEWLHEEPSIFAELINDETVDGTIDLIPFNPETVKVWTGSGLSSYNIGKSFYGEYKFKRTTWYDFFATFIVPSIKDKIVYNSPVESIDYTGKKVKVKVKDKQGSTFEGDRILVTVPINILKSETITFKPALPKEKMDLIKNLDMSDGLKAFISFSERFYPDIILNGSIFGDDATERIYYNAAFKKDAKSHVMGLFTVGQSASAYTNLKTDKAIIAKILGELDQMFDNKASKFYLKHVVQNWSAEPFVQGSYSHHGDNEQEVIATLVKPLDNKVYFAGEALAPTDTSTVHGAGASGLAEARKILEG